ncbi:hypothetical protein QBC32DRAFT_120750 [Pseudoneurospora amorphoporcata]|uniref:Uncharacterized protein n=1 Tax=Pseudoneurospora amorphoporcata TaxID=241081 RepID=A0AAN6NWQ9_9PEZI|nr:hypothetical protein QBC32DRAFT_120750 [Pseudoneurospora amorphoporcata]
MDRIILLGRWYIIIILLLLPPLLFGRYMIFRDCHLLHILLLLGRRYMVLLILDLCLLQILLLWWYVILFLERNQWYGTSTSKVRSLRGAAERV